MEPEIENRSYAAASPPVEALVPASTATEALVHHQGAHGQGQDAQQPQLQQTAYCGPAQRVKLAALTLALPTGRGAPSCSPAAKSSAPHL